MRRLAVLAGLVVALAGCGGGEEAAPEPETVEGEVTTTQEAAPEPETVEGEVTTTQAEPSGEGNPEKGKTVFASAGCGSCHTLEDAGSSGSVGPNLDESKPSLELAVERVTNGAGPMPSFKDQLSEQEIADVAAYVVQATSG